MFSRYLNNLQIRYKLLLLLIFPVAILILFTSYGVSQKWHQYGEARATQNLYRVALGFSNVIHALQKERGLSAGYLGSKGSKFHTELDWQRKETDHYIQDALSLGIKAILPDSEYTHLRKGLSGLTSSLKHRHMLRHSVDVGEAKDVFDLYSNIIANTITLIENIGVVTDDAILARNDQAYSILLWLQEFTGRERGLVNGLLASGKINNETASLVTMNITKQDHLLKRFKRVIATTKQKEQMKSLLASPAIINMRAMRLALRVKTKKLDMLDRLQIITGYGGLIHQFKNYVIRGDEIYKANFIRLYAEIRNLLDDFRNIPHITEGERAGINAIEATFQKYHLFLNTVEQMRKERATIDQIDRSIKIDDTPAITAITRLRTDIQDIDSADWFEAATKSINLFKIYSDTLRQDSLSYIKHKTDETLIALTSYVLLTMLVLLSCLYLGVTITRRLVVGTVEITQALQRVEDSGDFSGYIQVYGNDEIAAMGRSFNSLIEGRHAAESRLHLAYKVFNSTIDGILITDTEQKIISINRAATTITGFTEDEMIGKAVQMLSYDHHDQAFFHTMQQTIVKKGSWQGDIWNQRKDGEIYPQWQNISEVRDEQDQLVNYISVFSDISALKQSQKQLEHLAHHDPLTGLPNRLLMDQHLSQGVERAHRQNQLMAVLFLDLDHFKNINDSLGHSVGDILLQQASKRLKRIIRAEDLVARLGGDEFAIVLESPANEQGIGSVAQKCIDAFIKPFRTNDHDVYVSTSIGISVFPTDGASPDELIKYADTAMYHAKEHGRNAFQFYNKQMTELAVKRLTLESKLRSAIKNENFVLHYQPQLSLNNGQIIGVEALVRWQSPTGELIMPDTFIPVAEDSGLIKFIDAWVIQKACLEAAKWQSKGIFVFIAINISGFSIEHNLLIDMVKKGLEISQINPECLELEITEGYLMQHKKQAAKIINELQSLGVRFSIDDFGTGYSSLSYMKSLPINKLKIDRSFIQDIQHNENDKAIATSVIALGHSMQMQVIAEGVETQEQIDILSSLECDFVQGYFYSKPVTGDKLMELLKQQ